MTAIEWLAEQQKELVIQIKNGEFQIEDFEYYNAIYIQQAKEMENKKAHEYAEFAIRCDRKEMKILNFEDWIKLE